MKNIAVQGLQCVEFELEAGIAIRVAGSLL